MSSADDRLAALRAARAEAQAAFKQRVERARTQLSPGAIATRAQAELTQKAHSVATQALEIASDNRGIFAGTAAALLLWLARRPLLKGLGALPVARLTEQAGGLARRLLKPGKQAQRDDR